MIIKHKIAKVVIAAIDPDQRVNSKSIAKLRANSIEVDLIEIQDAIEVNRGFFKAKKQQLPFVTAKIASSSDGKIALKNGNSKWITSNHSRKIGHFLRFDKSALEYFLRCKMNNIFCTKIASRICRTYTDSHGLKNLVQEFCNKNLDKRQGSSDWNKNIDDLSEKQLEYAANDVIFLHKIKNELEKMLIREKRIDLYKKCIDFLDTRTELDQNGFKFDIFEH